MRFLRWLREAFACFVDAIDNYPGSDREDDSATDSPANGGFDSVTAP